MQTINGIDGKMNWQTGLKCENCIAYQDNSHRAWTILADFQKAQERIKDLEKVTTFIIIE